MAESLVVALEGRVAGLLERLADGALRFTYDEDYRRSAHPTPISTGLLELRSVGYALEAWLWGLLPDNEIVLSRWAREFHASASSPFSLLGTPVGHDCAGAVQFAAPDDVDELLVRPGDVAWLTEEDVAARLRELREDASAWLGRGLEGQFSLAGAQAKTALLEVDGRWGVPSGAAATSHILKPAVAGFNDHDLNEHLCLDAARRAGLVAARTRVARFGEESAIVVERYDRVATADGLVRVHQEDACQALGVHPARKYENEGGPGAADVVGLLRRTMPRRAAEDAVWRFVDALIWNWLIAGTDAHAKNYSLLLSGSQVRLAPLYDIASVLPYPNMHENKLKLAMRIGGDYRVSLYHDPWPKAADELGVDADRLGVRVGELATAAPDAFADAARAEAVAVLERPLPARLVDLVADRAARCAKLVTG